MWIGVVYSRDGLQTVPGAFGELGQSIPAIDDMGQRKTCRHNQDKAASRKGVRNSVIAGENYVKT